MIPELNAHFSPGFVGYELMYFMETDWKYIEC